MEIIKYNRGLIMFYVGMIVFTMLWVSNVEKQNDKITQQKNAYILNERGY